LAASVHVNVFHRDLLLALNAMAIERIEQHRRGARELAGLNQTLASAFERLFPDHRPPVAFGCGIVRGEQF